MELNALASGMFYRVAGVLSVHLQREVHGLTAAAFFPEAGLSREEAGAPAFWEAAVAAAVAACDDDAGADF